MKTHSEDWSRRDFLRLSTAAGAGATLADSSATAQVTSSRDDHGQGDRGPDDFNEATIAQLQAAMARGRTSAVELTRFYLNRIQAIDERGPHLNSVIQLNPDALEMAQAADDLRRRGRVLGPLHGIPVLLKDNIDTGDQMQTTAGSFALVGQPAPRDATVAAKLRAGGAVLLGKANLSEWANFRSFDSSSGWSAVGGQRNNPYAINRNPCGSSSGSGAAVSANLCAVSLATETDGSIVCPAHNNGVVGIKPTVGVTSRAGVVPISHTQDTIGPHARTVADAAAVLQVIASRTVDRRDPATGGVPLGLRGLATRPPLPADYTAFVDPNGLRGARIGVTRQGVDNVDTMVGGIFDDAIAAMRRAGATIVDLDAANFVFPPPDGEFLVLVFEFVDDLRNYFATRVGVPLAGGTLDDLIAFNDANAAKEMPFFGQEILELAASLEPGADTPQPAFGRHDLQRGAADRSGCRWHERHRPSGPHVPPPRDCDADRHGAVDDRRHQRRPLRVRDVNAGGDLRLSDHQRADGGDVRIVDRHQLHRPGVQRRDAHPRGRRLRERHTRAPRAEVLPDAPARRERYSAQPEAAQRTLAVG